MKTNERYLNKPIEECTQADWERLFEGRPEFKVSFPNLRTTKELEAAKLYEERLKKSSQKPL